MLLYDSKDKELLKIRLKIIGLLSAFQILFSFKKEDNNER